MAINVAEWCVYGRVDVDKKDKKGNSAMYSDKGLALAGSCVEDGIKESSNILKNPSQRFIRCL